MKRFLGLILAAVFVLNLLFAGGYEVLATENPNTTEDTNESTKPEDSGTQNTTESTSPSDSTNNVNLDIESKAAVLMEGSTGEVIYAKNMNERLRPASITKVMTLILIFEAIDDGLIHLNDEVTVSEHAASMGGSQVYLEPFETQTVDTMIKCISICSANDACVSMSEFVAGSETEFVARMNAKAKELGMENTNFVNCCGLDVDNHYSSAYDVALMSRELITKHPEISNYSTVWMDTITHTTRKGTTEFGLTNTNKLVKSYNGITGLKTGSTSLAKYCLTASARREGMDMIAVVMAAPETKLRFREAAKLMDYGFSNCKMYKDDHADLTLAPVKVKRGVEAEVACKPANEFSYVCLKDKNPENVVREVKLNEEVIAPIQADAKVGEIDYYYNGELIGTVDLISEAAVKKAKLLDYMKDTLMKYLMDE